LCRRARRRRAEDAVPLLEVRDLSKHFFRLSALHRVSLRVEPGDLLGLIGPNGSGKTTLFNCATGVLRPSGGQVLFKGEDITGLTADAVYRRGIARTFQLIQLFPEMTVLENLLMAAQERTGTLFGRLLRREEVAETDRAMKLIEYLGIGAVKDNPAANLSYGQQKLLDFGMALMPEPEVILLDEPLAGVNPTMIKSLVGHILDLNARGHTFVVIEHNMEVVMSLCRRIVVLSQGEQIAEGTPAEVADDPAVLDAYFGR
jgi:branched-chain amino acid transport system ATP-binding protein